MGKTRQNAEKIDQTIKVEIEEKTRQSTESKQTFELTGKIDI